MKSIFFALALILGGCGATTSNNSSANTTSFASRQWRASPESQNDPARHPGRTLIIPATRTTDASWERNEWACSATPTPDRNVRIDFEAPMRGAYAITLMYQPSDPRRPNPLFQHSTWVEVPGMVTCYFAESRPLQTVEISRADLWCPETGRPCEYSMRPVWVHSARVEVDGRSAEVIAEPNIHNGTVQTLRLNWSH